MTNNKMSEEIFTETKYKEGYIEICNNIGSFVRVITCNNNEDLIKIAKSFGDNSLTKDTLAVFIPVVGPNIGIIMFDISVLELKIIAHECLHAAIEIMRKKSKRGIVIFKKFINDNEEDFCHLYDSLFLSVINLLNFRSI